MRSTACVCFSGRFRQIVLGAQIDARIVRYPKMHHLIVRSQVGTQKGVTAFRPCALSEHLWVYFGLRLSFDKSMERDQITRRAEEK